MPLEHRDMAGARIDVKHAPRNLLVKIVAHRNRGNPIALSVPKGNWHATYIRDGKAPTTTQELHVRHNSRRTA